jgi:hypothetical protein
MFKKEYNYTLTTKDQVILKIQKINLKPTTV